MSEQVILIIVSQEKIVYLELSNQLKTHRKKIKYIDSEMSLMDMVYLV